MSITRHEPGRRFSQAVVHGDTVYLAGQTSSLADAGVYEQTVDILARIDALLAAAGSDKTRMLMVNVWLVDIGTFDEMNRAWDEWVDIKNAPMRACLGVDLEPPHLVEIVITAALHR